MGYVQHFDIYANFHFYLRYSLSHKKTQTNRNVILLDVPTMKQEK